jgi:hypothetical protein
MPANARIKSRPTETTQTGKILMKAMYNPPPVAVIAGP